MRIRLALRIHNSYLQTINNANCQCVHRKGQISVGLPSVDNSEGQKDSRTYMWHCVIQYYASYTRLFSHLTSHVLLWNMRKCIRQRTNCGAEPLIALLLTWLSRSAIVVLSKFLVALWDSTGARRRERERPLLVFRARRKYYVEIPRNMVKGQVQL